MEDISIAPGVSNPPSHHFTLQLRGGDPGRTRAVAVHGSSLSFKVRRC